MFRERDRTLLFVIDAFAALTAVGGGIALATGLEGDRFPDELLAGTPFCDYVAPGVILALVVGGTASVATVLTWRGRRAGGAASVVAGAVMMGWIGGEFLLLNQPAATPIELFYFALGAAMAGLGWAVARS